MPVRAFLKIKAEKNIQPIYRYTFASTKSLQLMQRYISILLCACLVLSSCAKDHTGEGFAATDFDYLSGLSHEQICLGEKLKNPYTIENVAAALASVYPTKARVEVETTNLYVRFLPKDDDELALIDTLTLSDHPVDYRIVRDGDYYHDPEVPDDEMTWLYAVVDKDYVFPDIQYEILDKCFISEYKAPTRADDGIDWDEVIRESYRLTGNGDMLSPQTKAGSYKPQGRITIVDPECNGGKPVGVTGVRIRCNSFVKFARAFTDKDGYYKMDKSFTSDVRYKMVFTNERKFGIGFNFILVPASVSTLGKASPEGIDVTITEQSDDKLWRRAVVNNAVYDYIERCRPEDLNITPPTKDLRLWLFPSVKASSSPMLHHGTVVGNSVLKNALGEWSVLLSIFTFFAPDITIGTADKSSYKELYGAAIHELAHASHFETVGTDWWDKYIKYILLSYVKSGGVTYGDGSLSDAGYCEIGEMWAYYLENKVYQQRYGGNPSSYGYSWWFYPQIFRYLEQRGVPTSAIFAAMTKDVATKEQLKAKLLSMYPGKQTVIEQVFARYE